VSAVGYGAMSVAPGVYGRVATAAIDLDAADLAEI
jgi:hypothetical protein